MHHQHAGKRTRLRSRILWGVVVGFIVSLAGGIYITYLTVGWPWGSSLAKSEEEKATVLAAGLRWLNWVDNEEYDKAWHAASQKLNGKYTREVFVKEMTKHRALVGRVSSRKLNEQKYTSRIRFLPEGEYVILTFDATRDDKTGLVEVVVCEKGSDGKYTVVDFYLKRSP